MSQYLYNNKRVSQILKMQVVQPLQDILQVQDLLAKSKQIQKKIEFYQLQKKRRTAMIDLQIDTLNSQSETIKQILRQTMQKHKQKAISFPAVGNLKVKPSPSRWKITNEQSLMQALKVHFGQKEAFDKQFIKTKPSLVKKTLQAKLNDWDKANDWPVGIKELVFKQSAGFSVSISYTPDLHIHADQDIQQTVQKEPLKQKTQTLGQGDI